MSDVDMLRRASARLRELPPDDPLNPAVVCAFADLLQVISWCPSAGNATDMHAALAVAQAVLSEEVPADA